MARKIIDCRLFPSEKKCTLAISGTEAEVLDAAVHHATTVHGHANSPELREQIRSMLKDEPQTKAAAGRCKAGDLDSRGEGLKARSRFSSGHLHSRSLPR